MSEKEKQTKKFESKEAFSLWKKESKGGSKYFTGKTKEGTNLIAFYNTEKTNPNEPDLRVFIQTGEDEKNIPYCALWCGVSAKETKYLTGKVEIGVSVKVTGFFNNSENEKAPYIRVYAQDVLDNKEKSEAKSEPKAEAKPKKEEEKPEVKAGKKPLPF